MLLHSNRTVIHLDLDAFYAQVEQKRKGLPQDTPLAVQQWDGLIAVNYAARARGVTRHMRTAQALEACPDLVLVHVQTLGSGGTAEAEGTAQARVNAKACLQRYRVASSHIMRALSQQLKHGAVLEKGGLDEVFMDVTPMVDEELKCLTTGRATGSSSHLIPAGGLQELARQVAEYSVIEGEGVQLDLELQADQRLVVAAAIAKQLRNAVMQDKECGYTCSAGIAVNKVLAKVGSARNKPNKQTLILPRAVAGLMQTLPLSKLRGLGGKLGSSLNQAFNASTASDVQAVSIAQLSKVVDDKAWWVFNMVRGIDDEPVKPKGPIKSLNSCKSFPATSNLAEITRWMQLLAEELAERVADDEWEHNRRPKSLVLHYRGGGGGQERSVRCGMPPHTSASGVSAAAIAAAAMSMFTKLPDAVPCVRLALSATEFHDPPADKSKAITRFLLPASKAAVSNTAQTQNPAAGSNSTDADIPASSSLLGPTRLAPAATSHAAQQKKTKGFGCFNSLSTAVGLKAAQAGAAAATRAPARSASPPPIATGRSLLSQQLHSILGPPAKRQVADVSGQQGLGVVPLPAGGNALGDGQGLMQGPSKEYSHAQHGDAAQLTLYPPDHLLVDQQPPGPSLEPEVLGATCSHSLQQPPPSSAVQGGEGCLVQEPQASGEHGEAGQDDDDVVVLDQVDVAEQARIMKDIELQRLMRLGSTRENFKPSAVSRTKAGNKGKRHEQAPADSGPAKKQLSISAMLKSKSSS